LNLLDRGQSPILGINESTPDHTINNAHSRNTQEKLDTNMNLILPNDLKQEPLNIYSIENKKNINQTYNNQLANTISNDIINKTGENIENNINPILNAKDVFIINPKKHDNDNRNKISNKKEATNNNNKRNKTESISSPKRTYKRPKRENNQKVEKIKSTKHNQDKFRTIEIQFHRIYEQISKIKMSDRHWIPKLNPFYNLEEDKNIIISIIEEFLKNKIEIPIETISNLLYCFQSVLYERIKEYKSKKEKSTFVENIGEKIRGINNDILFVQSLIDKKNEKFTNEEITKFIKMFNRRPHFIYQKTILFEKIS
ncbi:hypothetical protein DMUE_6115, partial [Dictyocoela muelleri]